MSPESLQNETRPSEESGASQVAENVATISDSDSIEALAGDARLVQRCIRGEVSAWEEIYYKCHEPLCTAIRVRLGRFANDPHLVDEIAARTWYAVLEKDGARLRKYSPRRGAGILTFLKLLAYDEITRHFLSQQRRLKREMISHSRRYGTKAGTRNESLAASLAEFLITLSPREQDFCHEYLLLSTEEDGAVAESSYSATNIRQLTHRIYKKFLTYIGH